MKVRSPLTKWGLPSVLFVAVTVAYAAVDQGYEDANQVPGTCPTNGSNYTDAWGFSACNCTSYVAYRLRLNDVRHGINQVLFGNTAWGVQWSNAKFWDDNDTAGAVGVRKDKYPAVGSVAHWNENDPGGAPGYGHVAYVQHLFTHPMDGRITGIGIMEYNVTPHEYTYRRLAHGRGDYPTGFLHFEEKGRDADKTNVTCVSGLSKENYRPSGANAGSFCWKHNGSNATCTGAMAYYYMDYRACARYTVTSSYCNGVGNNPGYTAQIVNGFPEPIDPTVLGTDFAGCNAGGTGYGNHWEVGGRDPKKRANFWRDLSVTYH